MADRLLTCEECGTEFAFRANGKPAKRCSETCRKAANARRSREARGEGAWTVRPRAKAPTIRACRFCGADFDARTVRAEVCYSDECQRAKRREQAKTFRDQFNAKHGRSYVPESYRDKKRAHSKARRARLRDAVTEVFTDTEIYERDGWICRLCSEPVDPALKWPHRMSASLDHIVPIILGGSHTRDNAQLAHLSCNSAEGSFWRELAKETA